MTDKNRPLTRRTILDLGGRALAGAGALSGLQFGAGLAKASGGAVDRALVCIYLFGGNDGQNMVVPLDDSQYDNYSKLNGIRAVRKDALLPVTAAHSQTRYGLHPGMAGLQGLFESKVLAVVANVQPPLNREDRYSALEFLPDGFAAPAWAARMAGVAMPKWNGAFTFKSRISLVSPGGRVPEGAQFENDFLRRSMNAVEPLATRFPDSGLGRQLQEVARLVAAGPRIGMNRQVFLCTLNGFSTSTGQIGKQAELFQELSQAMSAFYGATEEMGVSQRVTTFTDTELGRSALLDRKNGMDGAYGSHQLVMGGAVLGGDVYGGASGVSADQYAATLASWWGVQGAELQNLFPAFQGPTLDWLT